MLTAIKLQNQLTLKTDEVNNIGAEWHLPAELELRETAIPQLAPNELFGIGQALSQCAGAFGIPVHRIPPPELQLERGHTLTLSNDGTFDVSDRRTL
jgi:hypothetical protein